MEGTIRETPRPMVNPYRMAPRLPPKTATSEQKAVSMPGSARRPLTGGAAYGRFIAWM